MWCTSSKRSKAAIISVTKLQVTTNRWKTSVYFLSRWCTCSHQIRLHPLLGFDYITQAAPRRSPLSASPVRLADSQNQLVWPSFFFPAVRAAVVAWCQPTPTREEDISLPLFCLRAASNLPSLSSSPAPLASVPCQSSRLLPQPELSSNSSETSGRRRVLDSPFPPPARLGSLLWKLVESQFSFVCQGKKQRDWTVEDVGPCCL